MTREVQEDTPKDQAFCPTVPRTEEICSYCSIIVQFLRQVFSILLAVPFVENFSSCFSSLPPPFLLLPNKRPGTSGFNTLFSLRPRQSREHKQQFVGNTSTRTQTRDEEVKEVPVHRTKDKDSSNQPFHRRRTTRAEAPSRFFRSFSQAFQKLRRSVSSRHTLPPLSTPPSPGLARQSLHSAKPPANSVYDLDRHYRDF